MATPLNKDMLIDDIMFVTIIGTYVLMFFLFYLLLATKAKSTTTETTNPPAYHCVCNPETP